MQRLEQRVEPDLFLEIGGIFADDVRHGRPAFAWDIDPREACDPTSSRRDVERRRRLSSGACMAEEFLHAARQLQRPRPVELRRRGRRRRGRSAPALRRPPSRPWSISCAPMRWTRRARDASRRAARLSRSPRSSCCRRCWRRRRSSASASTTPTATRISTIPNIPKYPSMFFRAPDLAGGARPAAGAAEGVGAARLRGRDRAGDRPRGPARAARARARRTSPA